jgi:hypothetical protein
MIIRSDFISSMSTEKQSDVSGLSTVLFTDSFPQISRSLQLFSLPIQPFVEPNAV